jgi:hypothetical protein
MSAKPNIGDRVRIVGRMDDPDPIPVGAEGTVDWVGAWTSELTQQIGVRWDNGRSLLLLSGDPFEVIA